MSKQVAILAVNPVNGFGLFQYLESFFEKGISYKVFAVSDNKSIKTNSGILLQADDVVANLSMQTNTMHWYFHVETPFRSSRIMLPNPLT